MSDAKPLFWCNTHQREATHVREDGSHRCDPNLEGILMPCIVVDLTGMAVIEEDEIGYPLQDWDTDSCRQREKERKEMMERLSK